MMYRFFSLRAFSLVEIMITLAIMVIASFFISPVIFKLQDRIKLQNEIENLQSFIYQVQTKARYYKQSYSLTISQNSTSTKGDRNNEINQWCIIAIKKPTANSKQIICDCLNLKSCVINDAYFLYQNQFPNIVLKNKSLYPKSFISIDGVAGRLESKCLHISLNNESDILQFDPWGRVYVNPKNKRSTCRD